MFQIGLCKLLYFITKQLETLPTSPGNDVGNKPCVSVSVTLYDDEGQQRAVSEFSYFVSGRKLNCNSIGIKILNTEQKHIATVYVSIVTMSF